MPGQVRYLRLVAACAAEVCQSIEGLGEETAQAVLLAVLEACPFAIDLAHDDTPDGRVKVVFSLFPRRLEIDIYDWREGFDLTGVAEPDLEGPDEGGYGLMDEVSYYRDPVQGNRLHLVKYFGGEDHA